MSELKTVVWAQWPQNQPRPSQAEIEAARERYRLSLESRDDSDFVMGLEFVMATFDRSLWWGYFFPSESKPSL